MDDRNTATIERLERMLASGRDDALLRFGLGNALVGAGKAERAVPHLERAVAHDPDYSAAWKLLGKAHAACGNDDAALDAWRAGVAAADRRGDVQASREMNVFIRRIERARGA